MTTPITYYGGKQMLADTIIGLMPAHKIYVEPFFGGGAVFWRKQKSYIEAINDTNHLLINFYRVCQNDFDELEQLVSCTLHSEAMHHHARDIYKGKIDATDVQKAWAVWLLTNNSFGGKIGGGWRWCNGRSGSHAGISFCKKRNAFTHRLCDRLAEVQISCRDALACIAGRDADTTFFYLDPPYPGSDQGHYRGYSFDDFTALLDICEYERKVYPVELPKRYTSGICFAQRMERYRKGTSAVRIQQGIRKPQNRTADIQL
ncbi:MAG: DNA adenine methylase [Bacteroidales bacterium]|jgi:DNA adenine methylase|nr:DNA adenine methylase [Bacteroidales bacterium]